MPAFHRSIGTLVISLGLSIGGWAQQTIEMPFLPNQPPVKVELPEGYSLRSIEGIKDETFIFCPWNEYFSIHPFRYQRVRSSPVQDEAAMAAELEDFSKANPRVAFSKPQVWMTAAGPRGSMETSSGEKDKQIVGLYLFVPRGNELSVLTTLGTASSFNDQKLIHELFRKGLERQLSKPG